MKVYSFFDVLTSFTLRIFVYHIYNRKAKYRVVLIKFCFDHIDLTLMMSGLLYFDSLYSIYSRAYLALSQTYYNLSSSLWNWLVSKILLLCSQARYMINP